MATSWEESVRTAFISVTILGAMLALPVHAASVDAYAYSVSVQSGCATSGPTPNITATGLNLIHAAFQALPCTAGQNLQTRVRTTAQANAVSGETGNGLSSFGSWSESGTSVGQGFYAKIAAKAHAALSGHTDGFTLAGHEAFGRFDDMLTFTNGSGPGIAHLVFTTTGHGTFNTRGSGEVSLNYIGSNSAGSRELMRLVGSSASGWDLRNDGQYLMLGSNIPNLLPSSVKRMLYGWNLLNFQSHFDVSFTYGTPMELRMLLFASAFGASADTTNVSDFMARTELTGITVSGNPTAQVTAGSGHVYPITP